MTELSKRVLFAVPAALLFLFFAWLGGWYFKSLIILICMYVVFECLSIASESGAAVDGFFPFTFGLWILLFPELSYAPQIGMGLILFFIIIQLFIASEAIIKKLSVSIFCGLYAPIGFLALLLVRNGAVGIDGFLLLLALLLMIWGNDIFAYFGGKWFGKRRLAPSISPNKTWEGFWLGFLGSLAGLSIPLFLLPVSFPLSAVEALPMVLVTGLLGPVGDLTESRFKREAGVKDSSGILPGHGGLFDRFDALITAAPGVYLYLFLLKMLGYVSF